MKSKNVMVAQHLGFTFEKNLGWYDNEGLLNPDAVKIFGGNCFDIILFDKSWDWLIPAMNKVVKGSMIEVDPIHTGLFKAMSKGVANNDISISFEALVEYIELKTKGKCWD